MCEADMQIRALARRRGVAGNATVTTATYNVVGIIVIHQLEGKRGQFITNAMKKSKKI